MAYFLVCGDEETDVAKLKRLIYDHIAPSRWPPGKMCGWKRRISVTSRATKSTEKNDRAVSHRLHLKSDGNQPARIRTRFDEPYTASQGRYDVEVRYRGEQGKACRFALFVNGTAWGIGWESSGESWATHTLNSVEIRATDTIAVQAEGDTEPA